MSITRFRPASSTPGSSFRTFADTVYNNRHYIKQAGDAVSNWYDHSGRAKRARTNTDQSRSSVRSGSSRVFRMPYRVGRARTMRGRGIAKSLSSRGSYKPSVKGRTLRTKKKPHAKVSKRFSAKVSQVMEKKMVTGKYSDTWYGALGTTNSNQQVASDTGATNAPNSLSFDPLKILHVASVLFNKKAPAIDHADPSVRNFNSGNLKVEVLQSKTVYNLRNNSHRQAVLKIYECTTHGQRRTDEIEAPSVYWANCLAGEVGTGQALSGSNGYAGVVAPATSVLYTTPGGCNGFKKIFKYSCKDIVMEAGESYIHVISGPTGSYDFAKFFTKTSAGADTINDWQPGKSVSTMFVVYWDVLSATSGIAQGRWYNNATTDGDEITIERTDSFVIGMPEQAGFVYPAAFSGSSIQDMGNRHSTYCHNVWTSGTEPATVGSIHNVNERNPQADVAP